MLITYIYKIWLVFNQLSNTLELSVEFDKMVYSGSEGSGVISVTLSLIGGTSSFNISVTVMPSDQSPVSAKGNNFTIGN